MAGVYPEEAVGQRRLRPRTGDYLVRVERRASSGHRDDVDLVTLRAVTRDGPSHAKHLIVRMRCQDDDGPAHRSPRPCSVDPAKPSRSCIVSTWPAGALGPPSSCTVRTRTNPSPQAMR